MDISIDITRPGPKINSRLYGMFLEEINHGVDGGLYGELIRNRGFEDSRPPEGYTSQEGRWVDTHGFDSGFSRYGYSTDGIPFWSLVREGNAKGAISLETTGGVTEQSAYCLRLDVEDPAAGRLGVANAGFFGIGVKQGERVQAGHVKPFGLKYIEIGNENQGPEYGERYRFVYDALKSRYPQITYLADLSWTRRESLGAAVLDIEDRHYYNSPRWFFSRFHQYDDRDRSLPPLYLGEVAVTTQEGGALRGNLRAALAEGVFLMGCERNADVVRMVSYAPLLAHVEGRTELTNAPPPWHALIYFDGTRVFGTASYYLWKLFAANRPARTVQTEISFPDAKPEPTFFAQAGIEEITGDVILKAINTAAEPVSSRLTFPGTEALAARAEATLLTSASPADNNSLEEPFKVSPRTTFLDVAGATADVEFKPHSLTIIRFRTRAGDVALPERLAVVRIDPPEKGFFAKRLDYQGIPIKASAEVVDEALIAAYDRLDRMMARLPDVPASLAAAGVELHIIGRNQVTTDLPEWRHDKGKPLGEYNGLTRDQRTRGMGGRLTSCGEENLLRLANDRYRGRDICIHEFAHSILRRGAPKEIRQRFEEQRKRSLAAGLWVHSYAAGNVDEFFAELAMWYFGTHGDLNMQGRKPADGPEGLKDYDPDAFALVDAFWSGRIAVPRIR